LNLFGPTCPWVFQLAENPEFELPVSFECDVLNTTQRRQSALIRLLRKLIEIRISMAAHFLFPAETIRMTPRMARNQAAIGLTLFALVLGSWLAIHFWAMFAFSMTARNWPLVIPVFAVQCWLSVGMFIVAHDAMHGSLVPGHAEANRSVGRLLLTVYAGFGWQKLRDAHFDHHRHVGSECDPDFNAKNPRDFWPWYRLFLTRYFGWQSMAYVWLVVLTYFFVFHVPPLNILLLYGLPAIASSMQLFYFGTYRPHRHQADSFPDHHRARSNNYGTLTSLLSCFHFGYHHTHHLEPGVPWWKLPGCHAQALAAKEQKQ
jgi:beta-carotene/zeaxanthin 4-ketolase